MQWSFLHCILLVTAANTLSSHRPKRDLSYIKNLFSSKLLGTDTIVIQQPEIPKNQSYQLFKIKGYDNILLKVIRKPEKNKVVEKEKVEDAVMVTPEIAIIGQYLGTSTQGETLLAIEIVKNLLKTGILSENIKTNVPKIVAPQPPFFYHDYSTQKGVNFVNVLADEEPVHIHPYLTDQPDRTKTVHHNPVPVVSQYSPIVVASELKYKPLKSKYYYKQKGETADMVYESYNNQDVIVTRTAKEPPLPEYIKLRFADVAAIGVNPYLIRPQQAIVVPEEDAVQPMNIVTMPYSYANPMPALIQAYMMGQLTGQKLTSSREIVEEVKNINDNSKKTSGNADVSSLYQNKYVDKNNYLNIAENVSLSNSEISKNMQMNQTDVKVNRTYGFSKLTEAADYETKFIYKQINSGSLNNMNVDQNKDLERNQTSPTTENAVPFDIIPENFIFVPPKNVNVPMPTGIPKTNNINEQKNTNSQENTNENNNYNHHLDNVSIKPASMSIKPDDSSKTDQENKGSLKINMPLPLKQQKWNREDNIDFKTYSGGPIF